ncbi:MAG: L-lactate permease, partial [Bifidobacteriaceae bacterium]|jgi:lactate permease|nr:L-lactate permease [Bifidobacteriaceae bacterium]
VAVVGFAMPPGMALLSAAQGAVYGLFPIMWIVVAAVWLFNLTVAAGRFEDLREVFNRVGKGDLRIQAVLIAFCFGGLLEALAGFGAPVAITATILMAIGVAPVRAAMSALVANTAPVAFGAMAIPITTAGNLTELDPAHLGALIGRQTPFLAWFVPLLLVWIIDGRRGLRETWHIAIITGLGFAAAQFLAANYFSYELTDVVASLAGLAAAVAALAMVPIRRAAAPPESGGAPRHAAPRTPGGTGADGTGQGGVTTAPPETRSRVELTPSRVWLALAPYAIVIAVFGVAKLWKLGVDMPAALASTDLKLEWPGLYGNLMTTGGEVAGTAVYTFQWLSSPGTLLLVSGLLVAVLYSAAHQSQFRLGARATLRTAGATVRELRAPAATVASVLALAYVMNQSAQTIAIGEALAAAGGVFALLSPVLGWLGTAVTGSDTSANALFAKLQQTAAVHAGLDPNLMVAANTSGGVVGKMISPQNLAIAAAAVRAPGSESALLRKVILYSLALLAGLCLLVYLQSTPVLGWTLTIFS